MSGWAEQFERERRRYEDGVARLPEATDERQRQVTRLGNAAYGAGLCALMQGDAAGAGEWLARAADRYRESYADAPPGSWGRLIGTMKSHILAGDWPAAEQAARWALDEGAARAESAIGLYAAALALLTLSDWDDARVPADEIRSRDGFPADVGDALAAIAADDPVAYVESIESVLTSFETREEYLEDIAVADTVVVLQALAARRGLPPADLASDLLPDSP